jgi:hypothetical protein
MTGELTLDAKNWTEIGNDGSHSFLLRLAAVRMNVLAKDFGLFFNRFYDNFMPQYFAYRPVERRAFERCSFDFDFAHFIILRPQNSCRSA